MNWELTDEQIDELTPDCYGKNIAQGHDVAQAAQRKLVEWIDKRNKSEVGKLVLSALDWQELKKGVGL